MKIEVAQEWVEALRSGEYKQAELSLRNDQGFCCLGVLCDIAAKHGVGGWGTSDPNSDETYDGKPLPFEFLGNESELPIAVQKWADMRTPFGEIPSLGIGASNLLVNLANLNDGYDKEGEKRYEPLSFGEIADIIESKVSEL